ncbi:MAG TPA: winged helix-turn-helix domain-containing protein, partial [Polyangiaceae bacterium]|nr:winged helix-turn-helix domain-containing protein [Polyangiaceae bacterium]
MQYRFGDFVLDTDIFRLFFRNETVALRPQALDALKLLLEERHRVVTKGELLARVWNGSAVSENSLSQCIREVRRALGEDGQRTGSIRTVHRRGFRFVGEALVVRTLRHAQARPDYAPLSSFAVAVAPFEGDAELGRWVSVELARRLARHGSLPVLSGAANEGGLVARYVVAGSVQREGSRARLHLRVTDEREGATVWADRIELRDSDLFGLPDGLAAA